MALTSFRFESGANNDALTTGNTGADNVVVSGGTAVISTAQVMHGTRSARFTATSTSGGCYLQKNMGSQTALAVRMYLRIGALPSGDSGFLFLGVGSSQRFHLEMTTSGAIRARDDANGARWNGTVTTSPTALSINTWYRIELTITAGASTGTFRIQVFTGDGTTPILDSGAMTAQNTGSDGFDSLRIGSKVGTGTTTADFYIDEVAYDTGATSFIGPYTEALATPVVTIAATTDPTTIGGNDGTITVTWPAVSGAVGYVAEIQKDGGSWTTDDIGATSPHVFDGLTAGTYVVGITAKAA